MRGDRGQGLVELALILPFLLVLIVGIVEAGAAFGDVVVAIEVI